MSDRQAGTPIDVERALAVYLAEHRISRRMLLDRMVRLGAAAALAPIVAACRISWTASGMVMK